MAWGQGGAGNNRVAAVSSGAVLFDKAEETARLILLKQLQQVRMEQAHGQAKTYSQVQRRAQEQQRGSRTTSSKTG
jgi:hypothetical protein